MYFRIGHLKHELTSPEKVIFLTRRSSVKCFTVAMIIVMCE
jgi:hypothetical protein